MVRRLWVALSLVLVVAAMALVAGCVDSSEEDAQTPSGASTVANSAQQTDSEGKTVTATVPSAPVAGGGGGATTGGASTGGGGGGGTGDATAGQQVFAVTCTGCHTDNGNQAGVGPKLAGAGLDAQTIKNQVVNGGAAMPAGLVSGTDLDNVVAYVLSIQ